MSTKQKGVIVDGFFFPNQTKESLQNYLGKKNEHESQLEEAHKCLAAIRHYEAMFNSITGGLGLPQLDIPLPLNPFDPFTVWTNSTGECSQSMK